MSGKVYSTQTDLKIVVSTGKNLSGVAESDIKLKYKAPLGERGDLEVTISDAPKGIIEYITPADSPLDKPGEWKFWAHITENGLVSIGEPFTVRFYQEGN